MDDEGEKEEKAGWEEGRPHKHIGASSLTLPALQPEGARRASQQVMPQGCRQGLAPKCRGGGGLATSGAART